ncbi:MAG: hypothetical protein SFT81_04090 [Candidatus Caenarcaniphilales bacterium]|nr:hypothetical protein [Candidatus Caenarcaniphilales bacterium]
MAIPVLALIFSSTNQPLHAAGHTKTHHAHHDHHHQGGLKELSAKLFTPKRLGISALVLGLPSLISLIGSTRPMEEQNPDDQSHSHHKPEEGFGQILKVLVRLAAGIFSALFLERWLPEIGWRNFKLGKFGNLLDALKDTFKPSNLKLVTGLVLFNTTLDGLTHYSLLKQKDSLSKAGISLLGAITQLSGSFGLSRLIGGAGSLIGTIAASCPCCSLPVCLTEVITALSAIAQFAGRLFELRGVDISLRVQDNPGTSPSGERNPLSSR